MKFIKRLFCKHDFAFYEKVDIYCVLGERPIYKVCKKCGKQKFAYYQKF